MAENSNAVRFYIEELKQAPKDAMALAGGIATALGFFALVGFNLKSTFLREVVRLLETWVHKISNAVFSLIDVKLSIFATNLLFWFVIVCGVFYRAQYLGLQKVDTKAFKPIFDFLTCAALVTAGPFIVLQEATLRPPMTYGLLYVALAIYVVLALALCVALLRLDAFRIVMAAGRLPYGPLVSTATIFGLAICLSFLTDPPDLAFLEIENPGTVFQLVLVILVTFYISILIYFTTAALLFNVILAVSYPRALGGAVIAGVLLAIGDRLAPLVVG